MLDALERATEVTDRPLSAQPNAGLPKAVGDRKIYLASPEYMANYARRMIAAGARFVGGCCGTTPDHIRVIRDVVADSTAPRASSGVRVRLSEETPGVEAVPLAQRSRWGGKLARGEFVTCLEMTPPKGWVAADLLEQCRAARIAGVDAVHVLDGPRSQSRMSAIPSAIIVERETGLETLVHYSCRDRNMLGMISDLLGASAAGLRNILAVTGDPPRSGPYPEATAVFDIDSIGLTNVVSRLNRGLDPGGNPIGNPTRFVIGAGVNPAAADRDRELSRFAWKVDAGAEYALTRPVFDPRQLESFLAAIEEFRIPVIVGIWPFTSLRNAEYLANEVPGVDVPPAVVERMRRRQDDGEAAMREEGIAIARELLDAVRGAVQGVQISTPSGRVDSALEVLAGVGVAK
jgi:homocysteine S-methyltransferase